VIAPKDKREAIPQAMLELVAERGFHDAPCRWWLSAQAQVPAYLSLLSVRTRNGWVKRPVHELPDELPIAL
jgi:hypothetical protein